MSDRDLREAFESVREDDRRRAPAFDDVVTAKAPPNAAPAAWALVATACALAIAIVAWRGLGRPAEPSLEDSLAMATAISSWSAPTDEFAALTGAGIREGIPDLTFSTLTLPELPADDAGTPSATRRLP